MKGIGGTRGYLLAIVTIGILSIAGCSLANPSDGTPGVSAVELGTSGDFGVLSETGISTTSGTAITGDIGVSPYAATSKTGLIWLGMRRLISS